MSELDEIGMHAGASPEIFRKAEMLRSKMTLSEKMLWQVLKSKPLGYKFRRQHPFGMYVLDFYCHKCRMSIEIDGKSHDSKFQKLYDNERTSFIESYGIRELRFRKSEIINDMEIVKSIILEYLRDATL